MYLREIIHEWLVEHHKTGLKNPDTGCLCGLDHLMERPCCRDQVLSGCRASQRISVPEADILSMKGGEHAC